MSSTGRLGTAPWGAVLARPGGDDGSGGPVPGTVVVTAPITGDGSVGTPVGISAATEVAAGSMSAADKTFLDTFVATGVAWWPITTTAYFALDTAGGNDANAGFSLVSMAAAGAVAKKTWAGLSAILPRSGAGRTVLIAIKAGTYAEDYDFRPVGYVAVHTVATTDFSDSATDKILSGAATAAAGPNGDGSWTVVAGATTTLFSVAAGLATADAYTGWRFRFSGNVTAGLANICGGFYSNTATAITPMKTLPSAPAAGDTFFIERPGVVFNNFLIQTDIREVTRGIGVAAAPNFIGKGSHRISFCEARAASGQPLIDCSSAGDVQVVDVYASLTAGNILVGVGFRSGSGLTVRNAFTVTGNAVATLGGASIPLAIQSVLSGAWGNGCVHLNSFLECITVGGSCRILSDINAPNGFSWGRTTSTYRDMKADGGSTSPGQVIVLESSLTLLNTVITNTPSGQGAVAIEGEGCQIAIRNVTGSTGNTGQGLLLAFAGNCHVVVDASVTVTGAGGDVLYAAASGISGSAVGTWAGLASTNVHDPAGNVLVGAAGEIVGPAVAVTNKNGGAMVVGQVVRSNGTTGQVVSAFGNAAAVDNSNILGVLVTPPANNGVGLMVPPTGAPFVNFDGAPTVGAIAYLSPTTTGTLTTTVPAVAVNNNRLRAGRVISTSGSTARVSMAPEQLGIVATGAP